MGVMVTVPVYKEAKLKGVVKIGMTLHEYAHNIILNYVLTYNCYNHGGAWSWDISRAPSSMHDMIFNLSV